MYLHDSYCHLSYPSFLIIAHFDALRNGFFVSASYFCILFLHSRFDTTSVILPTVKYYIGADFIYQNQ